MTAIEEALVLAVGDRRGVLAADRLCRACVDLLAVDAAAISLVLDGAHTGTLGVSGERARSFDELQYALGEGPCLDSVAARAPVLVPDLEAHVGRWPALGPALLAQGIRAVFAVPVVVAGQFVAALDLFRDRAGPMAAEHLPGALLAADLAGVPVLDLLAEDLRAAAEDPESPAGHDLTAITRPEVSQATGVVVAQLDVTPAEALVRLRAHAFATGRPLTEVARDVLAHRVRLERDP